jgi:hypothetical protein
MELYVFDPATLEHVATITGQDNEACEAKAGKLYSPDDYGWTYSPAFGFVGGLAENPDALEINA